MSIYLSKIRVDKNAVVTLLHHPQCKKYLLCDSIFRALPLQRMCQVTEAGGAC